MSFKEITLGIDHSMSSTGFAVLGITEESLPIMLYTSEVRTKSSEPYGYRLKKIIEEYEYIVNTFDPEHVVREQSITVFGRNKSTQVIFRVVGALDLAYYKSHGGEIDEVPIKVVKKTITGNGKAEKDEMELAVLNLLQIDDEDFFRTPRGRLQDDIVDAVGIALTYYETSGIFKWKTMRDL